MLYMKHKMAFAKAFHTKLLFRRGEEGEPDQHSKTGSRALQKDLASSIAPDQESWPVPVAAKPQGGITSISLHHQSMTIILARRPLQGGATGNDGQGRRKKLPGRGKTKEH